MHGHDGAVALESLLVLPLLVVIVAALLGTTTVVGEHLAVSRAARAAARTVALTGEAGAAASVARSFRPGAATSVQVRGGVAQVTVRVQGALAGLPYAVDATAAAPLEPGAGR